jgi:hypothetical protein
MAAAVCFACGASNHAVGGGGGDSGVDAGGGDDASSEAGMNGAPGTFHVFDHIPQFGIYVNADPANYMPPAGVLMWAHGTMYVTKLSAQQQAAIGSDLAARITYFAQCDNYDRIGGIFFLREPPGQAPKPTDPQTELVRFITPFSDYAQGAHATHVYPNADLSAYAQVLADPTHDIWIGIAGGSNPYSGDPCVPANLSADFKAIGFKYSLDFVSTAPLAVASSTVFPAVAPGAMGVMQAIANVAETSVPIAGTFVNPGSSALARHVTVIVSGHGSANGGDEYEYTDDTVTVGGQEVHVTVIVSGHGSANGGDEYEYTDDTVTVGGQEVGLFSTKIDCAPFAVLSPDGNPGIFQGNTTYNPRNWCPGALVPSHTFAATLPPGSSPVSLTVTPSAVPMGSNFATSITFSSP